MSYTRLQVEWLPNAEKKVDTYGDLIPQEPIKIIARKQPHQKVVQLPDGGSIFVKSIFYVDPKVEPNASKIQYMDKLDGETIREIYIMCNLNNKPVMYRFTTE